MVTADGFGYQTSCLMERDSTDFWRIDACLLIPDKARTA